jgi:hypothetical protein
MADSNGEAPGWLSTTVEVASGLFFDHHKRSSRLEVGLKHAIECTTSHDPEQKLVCLCSLLMLSPLEPARLIAVSHRSGAFD